MKKKLILILMMLCLFVFVGCSSSNGEVGNVNGSSNQSGDSSDGSDDSGKMVWIVKSSKKTDADGEVEQVFSNEYADGIFKSTYNRSVLVSQVLEFKTENNFIKEIVSYATRDGKVTEDSRYSTFFTFDKSKNTLTIKDGATESNPREVETIYSFTFGDNNKLATLYENYAHYDLSSGERAETYRYDKDYSFEYSDNNYIITIKHPNYSEDLHKIETVTIPNDKTKNVTIVTTYQNPDGTAATCDSQWYFKDTGTVGSKPATKEEEVYNHAGYILSQTVYFEDGDVFNYFSYDEATKTTTYMDINDRLLAKYTYDDNGRIVHTLDYGYSGSTTPEIDATISYDENGNVTKCDYTYSNGGHYIAEFEWMQVPEIFANVLSVTDEQLHFIETTSDSSLFPIYFDRTLFDIHDKVAILGE